MSPPPKGMFDRKQINRPEEQRGDEGDALHGHDTYAEARDRGSVVRHLAVLAVRCILDLLALPLLIVLAPLSRLWPRPFEVGIGPMPIISSPYQKLALEQFGHKTEIFVDSMWFYTHGVDYAPRLFLQGPLRAFVPYVLMVRALFRYRTIYTYFGGGPLHATGYLCFLEPGLLKVAGIKTVIMGFGADVHVLTRSRDRYFVHAYGRDYPIHRLLRRRIARKIDLWTRWADHIIAGVDWVYYLPYWDTLCATPIPIDTERVKPSREKRMRMEGPLRLLHAPNHRSLKGTAFLIRTVEDLRREGIPIELRLVEQVPNSELLVAIEEADLIVDQLIIGWYAMFAIEAMALAKPCICYIDPKLLALYTRAGLLEEGECPLIDASPETIKDTLRRLAADRQPLVEAGRRGRAYVERHHAIPVIGRMFDRIQRSLN